MSHKPKFRIGQIVYLRTDPDQLERMVVGILERPTAYLYYLAHGTIETLHLDIEMTAEKDVLKAITSFKQQ